MSDQKEKKEYDGEDFKKVLWKPIVSEPVEFIKNDPQKKAVGKGSDENISICKDGTDGYDIEVRKQGDKEKKEREENHLRFPQRP